MIHRMLKLTGKLIGNVVTISYTSSIALTSLVISAGLETNKIFFFFMPDKEL